MSQMASGQGGNSTAVRLYNERVVLAALRRLGEASKADLARHASLTSNAAGQIVQQLERQRLVRTIGKRAGGRGQPATLLSLDPEGAYAIGVKLGRRSLHVALVDFNGAVLKLRRHDRAFSPRQALTVALSEVARMRQAIPRIASARLAGVGLAIPYNLGAWRRELGTETESDDAWRGFDFAAALRDSLDVPLFDENDGTAVAVAELFQGRGRELDDFVNIYIGTALGGGVVLGGEYRRGVTANAGDIGLMPVAPSRLPSTPKPDRSRDILLTRASISSLIRHVRANGIAVVGRADLDRAIEAHPGLIAEWLEDCADALVDPCFRSLACSIFRPSSSTGICRAR